MKKSVAKSLHRFRRGILLSMLVIAASPAFSMQAPDVVVKDTVDRMVNSIQSNRAAYRADNNKLFAMVEDVLIPALHVERMSNLILGRKYSQSATAEQKQEFAEAFKVFIMRSYATALLEYTGREKVIYDPVVLKPGADKVTIKATLVASDGQNYPINLYMSNRRDTKWRAYNLEVAGINFVQTYRATFEAIIVEKGVAGLIAELRTKNARTAG